MRIGIEAQRIFRSHKHGMDIVALELINALQQLDHENEYFIFVRPGNDSACLTLRKNFTLVLVPGLNYIHWEQIALPRVLRQYQLDILHCMANTAPLLTVVPLILTLHDVLFLIATSGPNTATLYQKLGNWYRALLVHRILYQCHTVMTVSDYARQQIRAELNRPDIDIEVLHNGVNSRFSEPITNEQLAQVRLQYRLPELFFLFLGSADPRKNMKNVLRAFIKYAQRNPGSHLVISGNCPQFLERLLTPTECEFVLAHCQFIGYIRDKDLPALYSLANLFLFPSISEGFGLPILESMACGTPVITSTLTSMPEVAGEAALLVDPHEPDQLVEAMELLHNDSDLRKLLIQRGRERAIRFSWKRSAQKLLVAYKTYETVPHEVVSTAYSTQ